MEMPAQDLCNTALRTYCRDLGPASPFMRWSRVEESRMRKILAMAGIALTSMLFTGSAFAQGAPPPPPAGGGAPADSHADEADKKIGIGVEGQFMLPLGDFGDATGPQI